jgi:hypothetical protein
MSKRSQTVTFHLACTAPRVWLVIRPEDGKARVLEMRRKFPGAWSARMDLERGQYRCRYYCGDNRNVVYEGPALAGTNNAGDDGGMDARLSVEVPEGQHRPAFSHRCVALPFWSAIAAMNPV